MPAPAAPNEPLHALGLKYQLSAEDYRQYLQHLQKRGSALARPTRMERLLKWSAVFVPVFIVMLLLLGTRTVALGGPLLGIGLFMLTLLLLLGYSRLMMRRYQPEPDGFTLAPRSLKLSAEGLRCVSARGMSQQRWHHLRGWEATEQAYYLYIDRMMAHIIPRRVLDSEQEVLLQRWLNQQLGPPPALVSAPLTASAAEDSSEAPNERYRSGKRVRASFSHNLLCGIHCLIWPLLRSRQPDPSHWRPIAHSGHILIFSAMAVGVLALIQYRQVPIDPTFSPWGLMTWTTVGMAVLALACFAALAANRRTALPTLLTLLSASLIWGVAGYGFWVWVNSLAFMQPLVSWCSTALFLLVWGGYCTALVLIRGLNLHPLRGVLYALLVTLLISLLWQQIRPSPVWYQRQDDSDWPEVDVEGVYYRQGALLHQMLQDLSPSRPGRTDLYFVGFANDGSQGVFRHEMEYARDLFDRQFDTAGRSMLLLNSYDSLEQLPLANTPNLRALLRDLAPRMDVSDDILVMYLTSHGTPEAALSAELWPVKPRDLGAEALREALDEAGIRWRILIIGGCYTGSFIPVLADEYTLIMTASAADRVSFGCGAGREFTYFGDALLRHGLNGNNDLLEAYEVAREVVTAWEAEQGYEPSEPQIHAGDAITARLGLLNPDKDQQANDPPQVTLPETAESD